MIITRQLTITGVANCNGVNALATYANGTVFCDTDDTGGGGAGMWIDYGTYLQPNTSFADSIRLNGSLSFLHTNLNITASGDELRISSNESMVFTSDELTVNGALTAENEFTVNGEDIQFSTFQDCVYMETDGSGNLACVGDEEIPTQPIPKNASPPYLYNDSLTIYFNETYLNGTIDSRSGASYPGDVWVNETGDTMTGPLEIQNSSSTIHLFSDNSYGVNIDLGSVALPAFRTYDGNHEVELSNDVMGGFFTDGTYEVSLLQGTGTVFAGKFTDSSNELFLFRDTLFDQTNFLFELNSNGEGNPSAIFENGTSNVSILDHTSGVRINTLGQSWIDPFIINTSGDEWIVNASGCVLWTDGTTQCTAPTDSYPGDGIFVNRSGDNMTGNLNMSNDNNITGLFHINPMSGQTLTINPFATGDVLSSEIDLKIGDDYGAISIGNLEMFLSNMSIGGLNLNGTLVFRNRDGNSSIKFAWAGKNNLIRYAIPMEGTAFAIYNPRSGMDGGNLGQAFDDGIINCTAQGYNNISNGIYRIDCATAVVPADGLINSGADRGVADDLLIGHDLLVWRDASIRGNVTVENNLTVQEKIFLSDLDHWLRQNASEFFAGISEQAFIFHHGEEHPEGTIALIVSANRSNQNRTLLVLQVGRNNSAGIWGNSGVVLQNNLTSNLTIISDCFLVANLLNETLRVDCDSFGSGPDWVVQDSIQVFGTIFADEGLRTNGTADIFLTEGNDLNIVGDTHIRKSKIELQGFALGSLVRPLVTDFEDGILDPFVLLTTSGSPDEWTATNDANCFDETCARASVISALGVDTIMEANFSTSNLDSLNLSFRLNLTNLDGGGNPDIFNVTINNNSGSGFIELFSINNGTNINNIVIADIPNSMDNVSIVSLRFLCNVNVINELCLVDDVQVNGTATANTEVNVTIFDTIIWLGDRTFRIFWNGSDNTLSLPGNITIENVVNLTTNSISLNNEVITNWDNVSLFDGNVLLRNGSRTLTNNWNSGNFNITADVFVGNLSCSNCIDQSMLDSTVNDTYVNVGGDTMTGNLNVSENNITDIDCLGFAGNPGDSSAEWICDLTSNNLDISATSSINLRRQGTTKAQITINGITIGSGEVGRDYQLFWDGESNDGLIEWKEDENYFLINDGTMFLTTQALYFRDTELNISSPNDGEIEIAADSILTLDTPIVNLTGNISIQQNNFQCFLDNCSSYITHNGSTLIIQG